MQPHLITNTVAALTSAAGPSSSSVISGSLTSTTLGAESSAPPFSDLLKNAIGNVQKLEDDAVSAAQGLMSGSGVDVHRAMITTQKSDMAFEMALAVRNKAVAAYQQVMQMQF